MLIDLRDDIAKTQLQTDQPKLQELNLKQCQIKVVQPFLINKKIFNKQAYLELYGTDGTRTRNFRRDRAVL